VKNPHIVGVRFIGLLSKAGFINETSTKNHFFTSLLGGQVKLYRQQDYQQAQEKLTSIIEDMRSYKSWPALRRWQRSLEGWEDEILNHIVLMVRWKATMLLLSS